MTEKNTVAETAEKEVESKNFIELEIDKDLPHLFGCGPCVGYDIDGKAFAFEGLFVGLDLGPASLGRLRIDKDGEWVLSFDCGGLDGLGSGRRGGGQQGAPQKKSGQLFVHVGTKIIRL